MVGHVTKISRGGGGSLGACSPRKFLNFIPHKSHFGVISNSEITYNRYIQSIGLQLRACGKLLAQALDDCGRGVAYRQIDW